MASSTKGPDMELKKAFVEMQAKMIETKQKLKFSDLQIENLKRSITHSELTLREISVLPEQTPVYESVGRMFMRSNQEEVKNHLQKKQESAREKINTLSCNKEYLNKNLKENENSLRELVLQKRGQ